MGDESFRRLLWWLIVATRGGPTRAAIIEALKQQPSNAHQLAERLKLDYSTVKHHLDILLSNHIIEKLGDKYGATYFVSQYLLVNYEVFEAIRGQLGKK